MVVVSFSRAPQQGLHNIAVEQKEGRRSEDQRFGSVVGRENVIAGSDCGFATFAGSIEIHPGIIWAKLAALAEGAPIASDRLWAEG